MGFAGGQHIRICTLFMWLQGWKETDDPKLFDFILLKILLLQSWLTSGFSCLIENTSSELVSTALGCTQSCVLLVTLSSPSTYRNLSVRGEENTAMFLCCFPAPAICRNTSFFSALWQLLKFWGKNKGKMWTQHLCFLGFFFIGLIATTFISHSTVRQGCNFPIT